MPTLRTGISKEVEDWVFDWMSNEFGVPTERITEDSPLQGWGLGNETELARLAGAFNRAAHTRPDWQGANVLPPELIARVKGKDVSDLINFLVEKVEEAVA